MKPRKEAVLESSMQKTHLWIKDVAKELHSDDRMKAYATLRCVLHALRACLPVEATAKLAAQMPLVVSGIYYDGWKPHHRPLWRKRAEFYRHLRDALSNQRDVDPPLAARAVIRVLGRHLSDGEMDAVRGVLPKEIREMWDEARAGNGRAQAGGWMRDPVAGRRGRWTPLPEEPGVAAQP